ncbi:photosystem II reaction center W protein, chloroplastic-like [Diospyros lotus]|uniref:photosystem II reaction center W protein, chloroplastic-like n=1 Tax=Diospyros lotus TaxID=55363 RepID=UPI002250D853|nr:photosystem II reaction center W protein, chloroplastic-like [Diospyros lotus]
MATLRASTPTSSLAGATRERKRTISAPCPVLGLAAKAQKGKVRCSMEEKRRVGESSSKNVGMAAAMMAAAAAAMGSPAMALVDERMSTEGTGLPFGLSNNLLVWIILGVFGLIWTFYIVYASTLEEDDESGLSL